MQWEEIIKIACLVYIGFANSVVVLATIALTWMCWKKKKKNKEALKVNKVHKNGK